MADVRSPWCRRVSGSPARSIHPIFESAAALPPHTSVVLSCRWLRPAGNHRLSRGLAPSLQLRREIHHFARGPLRLGIDRVSDQPSIEPPRRVDHRFPRRGRGRKQRGAGANREPRGLLDRIGHVEGRTSRRDEHDRPEAGPVRGLPVNREVGCHHGDARHTRFGHQRSGASVPGQADDDTSGAQPAEQQLVRNRTHESDT